MDFHFQCIDGAWADAEGGGTRDVIDPATESVVRTVPFGDRRDCRAAIEAAARAPSRRGRVRRRMRARPCSCVRRDACRNWPTNWPASRCTPESGTSHGPGPRRMADSADLFEWFAEEGEARLRPDHPLARAYQAHDGAPSRSASSALDHGVELPPTTPPARGRRRFTVVGRASGSRRSQPMAMTEILAEAGIPAGVISLRQRRPGRHGRDAGPPVPAEDPLHRERARREDLMVGASRTVTRLSLELGGNAPVIVLPDGGPRSGDGGGRGQQVPQQRRCAVAQRFLVHRRVADAFADAVSRRASGLKLGSGLDADDQSARSSNAQQRDRVEALVGEAAGAGVGAHGGRRPASLEHGYFFEPTVLSGIRPEMPVFQEEIFGPVMPVIAFDEIDEALALANRTPCGLAAYIWTNDLRASIALSEG
ncbi:MAG: aldehyde dehydrogenase family protein [Vicinamibacterales bacterium]